MSRVYFGLCSTEGDRLGHLVRGVQMLRSYGHEADIDRYSDVVNVVMGAEEPQAYACIIGGTSGATLESLQGICRETEWALGKQPQTLSVWVLELGEHRPGNVPCLFERLRTGKFDKGMTIALPGDEFARMCNWGQVQIGEESDVIGEWPSATGR